MIKTSAVSVDAVILHVTDAGAVEVLTHTRSTPPFQGRPALPGVLLKPGERLTDAAVRAAGKAGITPADVTGTGQLMVFDEPHRDPRGPTLSIATWVVVSTRPAPLIDPGCRWVDMSDVPALAFDHSRILDDVRPVLSGMLWNDMRFTKILIGDEFTAGFASAVTESLSGHPVHQANIARTLRRTAVDTGRTRVTRTGRPGTVWSW